MSRVLAHLLAGMRIMDEGYAIFRPSEQGVAVATPR
jgi:hypothetical protein